VSYLLLFSAGSKSLIWFFFKIWAFLKEKSECVWLWDFFEMGWRQIEDKDSRENWSTARGRGGVRLKREIKKIRTREKEDHRFYKNLSVFYPFKKKKKNEKMRGPGRGTVDGMGERIDSKALSGF